MTPTLLYLDPGTGGLLFSLLTGLAGTAYFVGKDLWLRLRGAWRGAGRASPCDGAHRVVIYSEGRDYASTFAPIVEELIHRRVRCLYLSSDADDPVLDLAACGAWMDAECIGAGPIAWARLRRVRAQVVVMTTPGLDVLQLRRSPHAARYLHLVHAPTDKSFNRTFSFDHFDAVVINGAQQARVIRRLERLRGRRRKRLHLAGCVYYDSLRPAYEDAVRSRAASDRNARSPRVLIAPTWGRNSLLQRHGAAPIRQLVAAGFEVVVRPHPQSWLAEPDVLQRLTDHTADWPNCRWDRDGSAAEAMAAADLLVSDVSGIAFDFAFLTGRPVLTLAADIDKRGYDAMDLPFEPWELSMLDRIGRRVDAAQLDRLARIAHEELARTDRGDRIAQLRADSVVNFGHAAGAVVDAIERTAAEADVPFAEGAAVATT